jgi:hypothetical protein
MTINQGVKKAIEWISAQRKVEPDKPLTSLIDEAVFKFDLPPKDSQFLYSFYKKDQNKDEPE